MGKRVKEKKSKGVIILLIIVIVVLGVLCTLFATGKVSLKDNNISNDNTEKEDKEINNNNDDEKVFSKYEDIYSDIINEYRNAISNYDENSNYKYVNEIGLFHYNENKGTENEFDMKYTFYDINKDGNYEMLINNGIIDIFSYDGKKIIRLFEDDAPCLAETRCKIDLYEDGTIYFSGSGGASSQYIGFYNINKDNSTLNTINSYYLKYSDSNDVTIYDNETYDTNNDTGDELNYHSQEELINENIHNTNKINLDNLNWKIFK